MSSLSNIEKYPKKKHYQDLAKDFNDLHKIKKIWETSQDILNLDNKIKFLKTHHVNCTMDNFSFTNDSKISIASLLFSLSKTANAFSY